MSMILAGGASTNSRAHRPLPPGAVSARTLETRGITERVEFVYEDGRISQQDLLTWVVGQHGCLWGSNLLQRDRWTPHMPHPIAVAATGLPDMPGSYGHAAEYALANELGQALAGVFPSDDLACRFYQSGGEALAAAARLARHKTNRLYVASSGYHGAGAEWSHLPNISGIPTPVYSLHSRLEWGDTEQLRKLAHKAACICVEVPALDDDAAIAAFLRECRLACDRGGAVFILDEVVTGLRLGLTGAAGRYGVKPDIACYGKSLSATGCVSAIVGLRELVEPIGQKDGPFFSTTFGGSPGPCAVAAATVHWLREHPEAFAHIAHIGALLKDGYNALGVPCVGQPGRSVFAFDTDREWLAFCSDMISRNVMVHRPNFPVLVHTEQHVTDTLAAAKEAIAAIRIGVA